jgi:hypothetical protein
MFVLSRATAVETFTPSALPNFIAIPASIPATSPFAQLLLTVAFAYSSCPRRGSPRAMVAAWFIPCHYVLLDAVCDPGAESLARLVSVARTVQGLRCLTISPLSGECPHRAAHQYLQTNTATSLLPASIDIESAFPNANHFGANYRIQLLSLHLATFPHPAALAAELEYGWLTKPYPEGFPPS